MSEQPDHVENDLEKPNKLAIASLIIGIFLLFPTFIFGRIFSVIAWIGIIYGAINIIKGNNSTKQSAKTLFKNMGFGVMSGILTGFPIILISQFVGIGKYWSLWLLAIAIPGALIIGSFAGGIGGVISGNKWKTSKAAILGGIVGIAILSPGIFLLFSSCALLGGC